LGTMITSPACNASTPSPYWLCGDLRLCRLKMNSKANVHTPARVPSGIRGRFKRAAIATTARPLFRERKKVDGATKSSGIVAKKMPNPKV
jgi:hypothetical protein